ncbi:MAG: hypothetical protein E6357_17545, partial [Clostridiales bacterium]|nr:hypothetical protein [Clostridiales bacterium]
FSSKIYSANSMERFLGDINYTYAKKHLPDNRLSKRFSMCFPRLFLAAGFLLFHPWNLRFKVYVP